ncbi:MAG: conjugal transfer protein TraX [Lachnospiraceae bacterium]|nr:conjugal transfer protein TraX [Lachnospiraceae bacterium]
MNKYQVINASVLKWIAVITMIIDHVGHVFFPEYEILRWIGRISFPLFAFLLTEGYKHTSNIWKYFLRLGIFAVISEVPYDYCIYGKIIYFGSQNIFFELLLGLLVLYLIDREYIFKERDITIYVKAFIVIAAATLAHFAGFDYRWVGILVIIAMYYMRDQFKYFAPLFIVIYLVNYELINTAFASIALILILLYNGKPGYSGKKFKWFFYIFYPLHLAIFGIMHWMYGI